MKKFNILFLTLLLFFLQTVALFAKPPKSIKKEVQINFNERDVRKKGIDFSQIFEMDGVSFKDIHIQYSSAMRFDANYVPVDQNPAAMSAEKIQAIITRAQDALASIEENDAYTTLLSGKSIELPIGITKQVGNKNVTICLDSIIFTPTYAYGTLYVILEDTKNDKLLFFYGSDIRFTKSGGFTGEGRLDLLETYELEFGQTAVVDFLVDDEHENYVVFDCNGFKKLHVDAQVLFAEDKFLYEDEEGVLDPTQQVTVDFMADFESLDNFMVQISNVPAFQVAGMEGTSFKINTLAFDYSSELNPSGIEFPEEYDYPAFETGDLNYWEGFYIDGLTIKLPEEFKLKSNTSGRITINVNQAMIDKLGFTGNINAENLIPLSDGDMGGWDYSLDYIDVTFLKSALVEAEFGGSVLLPITKTDQQLDYVAIIQPGNAYNFTITLATNLNIPMWGAGGVLLEQDSWINIDIVNKTFTPTASLNGAMSIGAPVNGQAGQDTESTDENKALLQISFQKLLIQTTAPYLSLDQDGGSFSVGSPALQQKMAKLPVSLSDIGIVMAANPNRTGIEFTVFVNLTGKGGQDGGISGNATLTVWGNNHYNGTKTTYSFYKIQLNAIELKNIKIAVLTLDGGIEFYRDDPAYGSGFSGILGIHVEIGSKDIGIDIKCIFGKKPSTIDTLGVFRYWAIDMLVSLPAIPVFPDIVSINAIGGGASMKMGMDHTNTVANAKFVTNTGVVYLPDESKGLGVKLMLGVQGPSRKAYEGQLIFEVLFNAGGGLSQISFSGYVQIMSLGTSNPFDKLKNSMGGFIDKVKDNPDGISADTASSADVYGEITRMADGGAIMAQWLMVYDRTNKSFMANLDLFVDVFGVIKGVNANAHAGRIDILFTPAEWHIFAGIPDHPVGLTVFDFISFTSYFMVGKNLYPPKAMPIPNAPNPSFPTGTAGKASIGDGFGTGVRVHIAVSKGGSFYYSAGVDAGFDILILNVAGQYCNGKPKGVKGWYGMGQAFLYIYGSIGFNDCANLPYPCNFGWGCCGKVWGKCWCWYPTASTCYKQVCVDIPLSLGIGCSGTMQVANPTYLQGSFNLSKVSIPVKKGKLCR